MYDNNTFLKPKKNYIKFNEWHTSIPKTGICEVQGGGGEKEYFSKEPLIFLIQT